MKTLISALLLTSTLAIAGHGEGNGGGAIVCADGAGKITSVTLLDLWEMEAKYPGSIVKTNVPKEEQLAKAVERLSKYDKDLAAKVADVLVDLESKKVDLLADDGILAPPSDTLIKSLKTPRNCPLSGAALYDDKKDTLTIDPEVIKKMTQTDLAALDFHEALYKAQRNSIARPTDSVSARKITGAIFSNLPSIPGYEHPTRGISKADFQCSSKSGDLFYITGQPNDAQRVQVVAILGERVFDKTIFDVTNENSHHNLADRLATGFKKFHRLPLNSNDKWANPYIKFKTSQKYGPSLKLSLGTQDTMAYPKCRGKESCHIWIWEKQHVFKNDSTTIMALTVDYDYRKGVHLSPISCRPIKK